MFDRHPGDIPRTSHHLVQGCPASGSRRRPVDVPIQNFCIFVFPVKISNRCVKQELLHLKNTFFIKLSIFCWSPKSPFKFPWISCPLGPLGNLQETSLGRRVLAGLFLKSSIYFVASFFSPLDFLLFLP